MIQELFSRTNIIVFTLVCFSFLMLMFSFEKIAMHRKSSVSLLSQIVALGELVDKINGSFVEYALPFPVGISVVGNEVSLLSDGFLVARNSSVFADAEIEANGTIFFEKKGKVILHG